VEICGKCGREPWDGKCNLLMTDDKMPLIEPKKNAQTRRNCGHPLIGESPLIIEAAERNKLIREEQAAVRMHAQDIRHALELQNKYYTKDYQP